jgi:hypothetical protein
VVAGTDESVTVNFTINNVPQAIPVVFSGLADLNDLAVVVSTAIAALDAAAGISATAGTNPGEVILTGDNAGNLTLGAITPAGTNQVTGVASNGVDQAQVTEISVIGTATAGDIYSLIAELKPPTPGVQADYTAVGADDAPTIANGLVGDFNTNAPASTVDAAIKGAAPDDGIIVLTDENADNGGFTITQDTTAAFGGSGASPILTGAASDWQNADIITDFSVADDGVIFQGLAAGAGNYSEAAEVADYATAYAAADTALDGSQLYYFTSATDLDGAPGNPVLPGTPDESEGAGLLFADANLDGTPDLVVLILGVDDTTFGPGNILAGV